MNMTDKPITLNLDDCDLIGAEVVETIYNNVKSRLNNMKLLEGDLPYIEVIAMELAMTDKILSDYIPNISHIFIEEYRALDELQKHCLFLHLMTFEKDETEITDSLLFSFEEDLENLGRDLLARPMNTSVKS